MFVLLRRIWLFFSVTLTVALSLPDNATARRAIPDNNLAYPVLVTLANGGTGSGFYISTSTATYFVTAKHVLFDPATGVLYGEEVDPLTHKRTRDATADLLSYSSDVAEQTPNLFSVNLSFLLQTGDLKAHPSEDVAIIKMFTGPPAKPGEVGSGSITTGVTRKSSATGGPVAALADSLTLFDHVLTGNEVILFGYPTSLGFPQQPQFDSHRPLLRKGIIAGKNLQTRSIILDCPAYQGNSGGPVIQIEIDDQNFLNTHFNIMDVVNQFIPFRDIWLNIRERYSNMTVLNSGYSIATPMDVVLEIAK